MRLLGQFQTLYLFIFLQKDFARTKSTKKHKDATKLKHKNANKQTKTKNALKKIKVKKSHLFVYLRFCACEEKNRKVPTMQMY